MGEREKKKKVCETYVVHEQSRQRRLIERSHRLINVRGESRVVRHKERDTPSLLKELERSLIRTIRGWNLNR